MTNTIELKISVENKELNIDHAFLVKVPIHIGAAATQNAGLTVSLENDLLSRTKINNVAKTPERIAADAPSIQSPEWTDYKCKGCRQPIIWRTNKSTGKRSPIDPLPNKQGDIELLDDENFRFVKNQSGGSDQQLYISHFKTCPKADNFGKGAKKNDR